MATSSSCAEMDVAAVSISRGRSGRAACSALSVKWWSRASIVSEPRMTDSALSCEIALCGVALDADQRLHRARELVCAERFEYEVAACWRRTP